MAILPIVYMSAFQAKAQDEELEKLKALSMEELMNLEVTSVSKRSEKLSEVASAVQVITNEDIRRSGVTSVPEALKLAPNLMVSQVNASQWAITSRGFNGVLANKLLVLINGRVVYTPMYAGVFWDVQNLMLEDIERIEVISGPGGTLWGANAVNGVINIITKSTKDTQGFYAEAAAGTELRGLASLRYGGKFTDKFTYRIYGTGFKRDNTVFHDSTDVEAKDAWQIAQGGLRFDWDVTEKDLIILMGNLYEGRPDPDGGNPVIARGTNILSRWNHVFKENSSIQIQAYFDRTWRNFRNGFAEKLSTYDIEAQHGFSVGRLNQLIYGFGFRYMDHDVTNLESFGFMPARKSLYLTNIFVQDDIPLISEKLKLTLGIKFEHNSYTQWQYQPNGRLTWTTASHHTIWGSVSRAVRNPSRIDREFFIDVPVIGTYITGSDFQSEELLAYELGWRTQSLKNISTSLSLFYNQYDMLRSVEPGASVFGTPITFGNGVEGDTYGAEFSATVQLNSWCKFRGGYTYLKKDLRVKTDSNDQNNANENNDATDQIVIQSTANFTKAFGTGFVLRYVGELPEPYVSDYVGLDMQLWWKISKIIEVNVTGQNLLQEFHTEFIPDSPPAKSMERSVYAKLICRF